MEAHIKCWEHHVANPRHSYFLHAACHSHLADWMANLSQRSKCRALGLGGSEEGTNMVLHVNPPAPQCSESPGLPHHHLQSPNTGGLIDSSQNSSCSTEHRRAVAWHLPTRNLSLISDENSQAPVLEESWRHGPEIKLTIYGGVSDTARRPVV